MTDFVKEFRAWANSPAESGFVPVHPNTLRTVADELERLKRIEAEAKRSMLRVNVIGNELRKVLKLNE